MDAKQLARLEKKLTPEMEKKHFPKFQCQAQYLGNGIYSVAGQYSTDTRELFIIFACIQEGIKIPQEKIEAEDE